MKLNWYNARYGEHTITQNVVRQRVGEKFLVQKKGSLHIHSCANCALVFTEYYSCCGV